DDLDVREPVFGAEVAGMFQHDLADVGSDDATARTHAPRKSAQDAHRAAARVEDASAFERLDARERPIAPLFEDLRLKPQAALLGVVIELSVGGQSPEYRVMESRWPSYRSGTTKPDGGAGRCLDLDMTDTFFAGRSLSRAELRRLLVERRDESLCQRRAR